MLEAAKKPGAPAVNPAGTAWTSEDAMVKDFFGAKPFPCSSDVYFPFVITDPPNVQVFKTAITAGLIPMTDIFRCHITTLSAMQNAIEWRNTAGYIIIFRITLEENTPILYIGNSTSAELPPIALLLPGELRVETVATKKFKHFHHTGRSTYSITDVSCTEISVSYILDPKFQRFQSAPTSSAQPTPGANLATNNGATGLWFSGFPVVIDPPHNDDISRGNAVLVPCANFYPTYFDEPNFAEGPPPMNEIFVQMELRNRGYVGAANAVQIFENLYVANEMSKYLLRVTQRITEVASRLRFETETFERHLREKDPDLNRTCREVAVETLSPFDVFVVAERQETPLSFLELMYSEESMVWPSTEICVGYIGTVSLFDNWLKKRYPFNKLNRTYVLRITVERGTQCIFLGKVPIPNTRESMSHASDRIPAYSMTTSRQTLRAENSIFSLPCVLLPPGTMRMSPGYLSFPRYDMFALHAGAMRAVSCKIATIKMRTDPANRF
jgi:hypothetical protein